MDDLLQCQIRESCKLALPNGLQDLMSDISREVLRAQPRNMYQYIGDYLEALLEARETLTIACDVCNDVCKCACESELTSELKQIGMNDEDIDTVVEMITKYVENDPVKEQRLLLKLIRKIDIDEAQLDAVQGAIQRAYKRRRMSGGNILGYQNEIISDNISTAVHHTLTVYEYEKLKTDNESEEIFVAPEFKPCITTVSSSTLAGSYIHLPKFKPYTAHISEILPTVPEKENASIDYTLPTTTVIEGNNVHSRDIGIIFEEIDEKPKACVFFDEDKDYTVIDNDSDEEDIVDEIIENIESENQSTTSSIAESLHDYDKQI